MHRLKLCCIALGILACSRGEQSPVNPWLTALSPAEHDRLFPIQTGPHALSCNACHGTAESFKQFDCTTCHTQPPTTSLHAGMAAFRWESTSCYACHPRGISTYSAAEHASYFPIGTGLTHALGASAVLVPGSIGCGSCHTTVDRAQFDCTTCHTQASMTSPAGRAFHASVPDLAAGSSAGSSSQCLLCHSDSGVPVSVTWSAKAPSHDQKFGFEVTPGSVHAGLPCLSCHSQTRPIASTSFSAADFTQETCTACHSPTPFGSLGQDIDRAHLGLGDFNGFTYANVSNPPVPADSRSCLNCHAHGRIENFDHSVWFPIGRGDTHALGNSFSTAPSGSVTMTCAACHQDPANRRNVTCTSCHTATGTNSAGPEPIDLAPAHASRLAGTNWQATAGPTPQCLLCHSRNLLKRVKVHGSQSSDAAIPFVIDATSTTHFVPCEKCHTAQVTADPDLSSPQTDFNVRNCDGCHSEARDRLVLIHNLLDVTPPVGDTVDALGNPTPGHAKQCRSCHPDGRAAPVSQLKHLYFPVTAGSHAMGARAVHAPGQFQCGSCHTALTSNPAKIDCTGCHTQSQMTTSSGVSFHAAVPDLVWPDPAKREETSLLCLKCHSGSKVPASVSYSTTSNKGKHDPTNPAIVFNVTPGSRHDTSKASMPCLTCHETPRQPFSAIPAMQVADFTEQSCTRCHSLPGTLAQDLDAIHAAVTTPPPGYQPVPNPVELKPAYSKTCLPCHADGQVDPAIAAQNHVGFFPIGASDSHAYLSTVTLTGRSVVTGCATCHVDTSTRQNVDCTGCHTQSSGVPPGPGVPADQVIAHSGKVATTPSNLWLGSGPVATGASARCLLCHGNDARPAGFVAKHGQAGPEHVVFGIDPASGSHFTACDQCHSARLVDPDRTNAELDFARASCDVCHLPDGAGSILAAHQALGAPITTPYAAGDPSNSIACLSCHPDGRAAQGNLPYHAGLFPIASADTHALGKSFAVSGSPITLACATCHQDMARRQDITCTTCHTPTGTNAAGPSPIDLAPAHARLGGTNWQAPVGPTPQCLLCHANDFLERIQVHGSGSTAYSSDAPGIPFVIGGSSANHFLACEQCHTTQVANDPHLQNPHTDFNVRTCNSCHSEAKDRLVSIHSLLSVTPPVGDTVDGNGNAVPGHAKECLSCHPDGRAAPISGVNHPYFPVTVGSVHAIGTPAVHTAGQFQCASCHTALISDPAKIDCTGCHTQAQMTTASGVSFHAAVPDLTWPSPANPQETSLLCLKCHADSKVPASVSYSTISNKGRHDPSNAAIVFNVAAGSTHSTSKASMPCLTCHSSITTPFPAVPAMAVTDFREQSCTTCHSPAGTLTENLDAIHIGVTTPPPGYQPLPTPATAAYSKTCLPCHANGQVDLAIAAQNHASWFPLGSADSHALGKSFAVSGSANLATLACATCHQDTARRQDVTCTTCHTSTGSNAAGPAAIDLSPAHANLLAGTSWQASPGPTSQCLLCHTNDFLERVSAHGSGQPPLYPSDAPGTIFAIASGPHFAPCESCHTSRATGTTFKNSRIDFADRTCDSCHAEGKDTIVTNHAGIGIIIQDPIGPNNAHACLQCHPDGSRAPSTVTYSHPYFPVDAAAPHPMGRTIARAGGGAVTFSCWSCHVTPTDIAQVDCTTCHSQASMTSPGGASAHASVPDVPPSFAPGTATSVGLCLQCHADGKVPVSLTYSLAKAATHDSRYAFLISAGSRHATTNTNPSEKCSTCHSVTKPIAGVTTATGGIITTTDFTKQTCTACHGPAGALGQNVDQIHAGFGTVTVGGVGYTYRNLSSPPVPADSKTCLNCHRDGNAGTFDHARWFPITSADTHALGKLFARSGASDPVTLACATCHQDPANRQDVTCITCHTPTGTNAAGPTPIDLAPAHATQLTGTNWQAAAGPTPQCVLCHANDFLERVNAHGSGSPPIYPSDFPGIAFAISSGPHFAACETCHTSQAIDVSFKNPRIDFADRNCDACHSEAKDRLVTNHAGIGITIHDPLGPNNAHACLQCHPDGAKAPETVPYSHPYFPVDSAAPHPMGRTVARAGGGAVTFSCWSCHVAPTDIAQVDCTTCHSQASMTSPGGTSAHVLVPDLPAPFTPGTQTSEGLCLRCHADGRVPVSLIYSTSKVGTHDALYTFKVSAGSSHATTNTNPPETCSTCHSVTRPLGTSRPITTIDFKQQTCTACHAPSGVLVQNVDQIHAGFGTVTVGGVGYTYRNLSSPPVPTDSKTCLNCHRDGSGGSFDHARWFPIANADTHALGKAFAVSGSSAPVTLACATCHQDVAYRQDVTCTTCHTPTGANAAGPNAIDLAPAHARLAGTNWQAIPGPTPQCLLCHADDFLERVKFHGSGSPPLYPSDFPGTTFAIANSPHFAPCEKCHVPLVTDPGFRNLRTDFAQRSCDACHGEAKDRLVTSHAGIGILIQDPTGSNNAGACLQCHADGGAAPSSVPYSHPFFPVDSAASHSLGRTVGSADGRLVTFACSSCHVTPTDFAQVDCTTCHSQANMTSPGGIVGAHDSVPDVPAPFTPGTETSVGLCLQCHADGKVPVSLTYSTARIGTHDALFTFQVSAGSHHATTNANPCSTCHSVAKPIPGATTATGGLITTRDFKQQTCTACHAPSGVLVQNVDQIHAGLGTITADGHDYTYQTLSSPPVPADSKTCLNCHRDGSIGSFDHSRWFPIASAATHALGRSFTLSGSNTPVTLACVTCHQDSARRPDVTCTTCHTPDGLNANPDNPIDLIPAHASQLGGSNWGAAGTPTPQCMLCHAKDFLERVGVHGSGSTTWYPSDAPGIPFVISSASSTHFVGCEECHTAPVVNDPALRNPRTDFSVRTCNGCHSEGRDRLVSIHALLEVSPAVADSVDAGGNPVPGHAKQCLACHPDGGAAPSTVAYSHPYFPVAGGSVHAMGADAVHLPGQIGCSSCHTALASDPAGIDCTSCHSRAQMTADVAFHAAVPDLTWPDPAQPQETSLLCLKCHADSKVPASVSYSTHSSKGTHDPSNAAIVFNVTAGASHDTAGLSVRMPCLTCHASTSTPFATVPAMKVADFTQQSCTNCHSLPPGTLAQDLDAIHTGVTTPPPGYQPVPDPVTPAYSKTCLPCHANGQIDPAIAAQGHAGFFPIGPADSHAFGSTVTVGIQSFVTACASCHVDANHRSNVDCTGCHIETLNTPPSRGVPADQVTAHSDKVATTPSILWLGTGPVDSGQGASARCLLCHANDARPAGFVSTHGTPLTLFPIDPASGGHFASCDQCHTAQLPSPPRRNAEFDFTQTSCAICHLPSGDESIVTAHQAFGVQIDGYSGNDPNNARLCLGCHPSGRTSGTFAHAWFPIAAADVHNSTMTRCADCHSSQLSYRGAPKDNLAMITCTRCHNDDAANIAYQRGITITQVHTAPTVGRDIWNIPGGYDYSNNLLCLECHAGNIGGDVALWSTPLVFRVARHDEHCLMGDKKIASGDREHNVNHNTTSSKVNPIVNVCFGCHNARATSGNTPWARDWAFASPTKSCVSCHQETVRAARCGP